MAHDGHSHDAPKPATVQTPPPLPLPFKIDLGDGFDLVDQFGEPNRLDRFDGKHALVFFGYANCESICSATLPLMVAAIDVLGVEAGIVPVMVTVDPDRDTPDALLTALPRYGGGIIGLTGAPEELARVRDAFHIETTHVGDEWDGAPIYSHGSFVYLLGPDGQVKTLIPPVVSPRQMATIIESYL